MNIFVLPIAVAALFTTFADAHISSLVDIASLAAKAGIYEPIASLCKANLHPLTIDAYALATISANSGGRYLVIKSNGRVHELGSYKGKADLNCYSPAEARALNKTLAASETIKGGIEPRFATTVVCAFLEETAATCWQYSPTLKSFVKVGSWVT